jgi:hypothetical protein
MTLKPPRIKKAGVGRPHKIPTIKRGRPLAITEDKEKLFLYWIEQGQPVEVAAVRAGVGRSTIQKYLKLGRAQDSGYYRDFLDKTDDARFRYFGNKIDELHESSVKDPRAIMAILERRFRGEFSPPKQALEVEGELRGGGQTIIVIQSEVPRVEKPTEKPLTLEERRLKMLPPTEEKAG